MSRGACCLALFMGLLLGGGPAAATQAQGLTIAPNPAGFEYWPGADLDPSIPSPTSVLGHDIGEEMVLSADARRYFDALAAAVPGRFRIVDYGRSWEGRALWYAVLGSPENLARLESIQESTRELGDPRRSDRARAESLSQDLPATIWLGYSVHGNEPGTTDAAMLTAYHLLASRGDARVQAMLANALIVINPVQNPDGRDRFIHAERAVRGPFPDADPIAAGRDEPWPGGRMNHYVFDLNRDWFAQTQPETRLQAPELLRFLPQVVVDVHEMGTDMTYFFAPEAEPSNPQLTPAQLVTSGAIGANNARWFDRFGLTYFTGEIFDAFYPGYGSGWPNYLGMTAMVYEQGSSRGLVAARRDGTELSFRDTVQSQFIAGLSAVEYVATNRERLLREFREYRETAVEAGRRGKVRAWVVPSDAKPAGARKLAGTLVRNGIEVGEAESSFRACGRDFAAGSFVIDSAQPAHRLLRTLMDPETPMDKAFIESQRQRLARGLPDEIYDVTAWSLPLMAGVAAVPCSAVPTVARREVGEEVRIQGRVEGLGEPLAWVVPWGEAPAVRFLAAALRDGLSVTSSDEGFRASGVDFPGGSLVLRRAANPPDVATRIAEIARDSGARVVAVASGRVESGPDFGSPRMLPVPAIHIGLLWDQPTERYSAGWARYMIEREFEHPVTLIRGSRLARSDLSRFDVIVLPGDGAGYEAFFGKAGIDALKRYVETGGVLVTISTATRFAATPSVDLIALRPEDSAAEAAKAESSEGDAKPAAATSEAAPTVRGVEIDDATRLTALMAAPGIAPTPVSGALVRATVDAEHWLAAGIDPSLAVLMIGADIYAPLRRDQGQTVASFAAADELGLSGVIWDDSRRQLAFKPFVVVQPRGAGMVVAFTQDPNVRAYLDGLSPLFANALFRAPAKVAAVRPY